MICRNRIARPGFSTGITALRLWLFCVFLTPVTFLFSQVDTAHTTLTLPEAVIQATRFPVVGYAVWKADSLPVTAVASLSDRLFSENILTLRQNAPGTLATLSARGAGAARTAVLWNGISLQSPMNGVADASLIPCWPGDQLEIVQGGYSAAFSNGAMGGAVAISTMDKPGLHHGLYGDFGLQAGSFGALNTAGSLGYDAGRWQSVFRGSWQQADNDFPFTKIGLDGKPYLAKQVNNHLQKFDFQYTSQWQVHQRHLIKSAVWRQASHRELPPAVTEAPSDTWQNDRATRAVVSWQFNPGKQSSLTTRAAWTDEWIDYYYAGNSEQSKSKTALVSTDWKSQLNHRWQWGAGAAGQFVRAKADGYQQQEQWFEQERMAIRGMGAYQLKNAGAVTLQLRQEWAAGQGRPFTWTIGAVQPIGKGWKFRGHIARNFNLPTFNDRFWKGLGKEDLKPEKGYSTDVGIQFGQKGFLVDLAGFYLLLDDWILWQPGPDGLFRPGNLRRVASRGLEAKSQVDFQRGKWRLGFKSQAQWSMTTNTAVYGGEQAVLGKQLPYTPRFSGSASFRVSRKSFAILWQHQFTGNQWITTDNQQQLPAYQTSSCLAQWSGRCLGGRIAVSGRIDNLWDVSYATLANRPMPGRSASLGFGFQW